MSSSEGSNKVAPSPEAVERFLLSRLDSKWTLYKQARVPFGSSGSSSSGGASAVPVGNGAAASSGSSSSSGGGALGGSLGAPINALSKSSGQGSTGSNSGELPPPQPIAFVSTLAEFFTAWGKIDAAARRVSTFYVLRDRTDPKDPGGGGKWVRAYTRDL
jgi:hypothetical protein